MESLAVYHRADTYRQTFNEIFPKVMWLIFLMKLHIFIFTKESVGLCGEECRNLVEFEFQNQKQNLNQNHLYWPSVEQKEFDFGTVALNVHVQCSSMRQRVNKIRVREQKKKNNANKK